MFNIANAAPITASLANQYSDGIDFSGVLSVVGAIGVGVIAIFMAIRFVTWILWVVFGGTRSSGARIGMGYGVKRDNYARIYWAKARLAVGKIPYRIRNYIKYGR